MSDFVYLDLTKQACDARVLSPHSMALFHVLTTGRCVCSLRISRELWVGVNRTVVVKSLNQVNKSLTQVNKSRVNKET